MERHGHQRSHRIVSQPTQPIITPHTTNRQPRYWKEGSIEANVKDQEWIRNKLVPKLAELTPGGAAYLNEADFGQPEWQKVFYGANYNRLRSIKRKYDPLDTFYGLTAVGSEDWESRPDGRLCRAW